MAEDNPDYRFDMIKMYIDTAIKMRGSVMTNIVADIDTQKALDELSPRIFMVMMLKIIFRIRTPDDIDRNSNEKTKKKYISSIDNYIRHAQRDKNLSTYKLGLIELLKLLDLAPSSNLTAVNNALLSVCDSIEIGNCEYHDSLFEVVRKSVAHLEELYESNDLIVTDNQQNEDV
jgi:hypothetical protein